MCDVSFQVIPLLSSIPYRFFRSPVTRTGCACGPGFRCSDDNKIKCCPASCSGGCTGSETVNCSVRSLNRTVFHYHSHVP